MHAPKSRRSFNLGVCQISQKQMLPLCVSAVCSVYFRMIINTFIPGGIKTVALHSSDSGVYRIENGSQIDLISPVFSGSPPFILLLILLLHHVHCFFQLFTHCCQRALKSCYIMHFRIITMHVLWIWGDTAALKGFEGRMNFHSV